MAKAPFHKFVRNRAYNNKIDDLIIPTRAYSTPQRVIVGTDIIATPAETFRHAGYNPDALIPIAMDDEQKVLHLRGMYQPLFMLTHAQDRLKTIGRNHKLRQKNKAFYNRVNDLFVRYFRYLFSGPSMTGFNREIATAEQDIARATTEQQRTEAQTRLTKAQTERSKALGYFDELDFTLENIFHEFDIASYGARNILARLIPDPDLCRLTADVIATAAEVQCAAQFTQTNLRIEIDPLHADLFHTLRQWADALYDHNKYPQELSDYYSDVYTVYIRRLNAYTRDLYEKPIK